VEILGINRVELVVSDPDKEADRLATLTGMSFLRDQTETHGVLSRTDFKSGIELAGPTRPDSSLQNLIAAKGEGLLTIVFRVRSVEAVLDMAKKNGIAVIVDLNKGDTIPGYKNYRQVSLDAAHFPAGASFTFCAYEEA